ncbi:tRNA epoxyqueuosine(34) reductase QueG [Granulicella sp. 5B5]|uniref:tRNA epoxyqueuosine(34) reductase QueG n=1 Tax=Granulicella sp. 5B5 TaxID=1617967 RepID=UPI0015F730CE|nr:tRNA epoxyqueuosine(34) reductase QueG [Granulicella sp. 5B5]QMV19785.1 tRNA epoxyqueuosine(34) reductase QueG [Granulicella sp. 5B5]
MLLSITDREWIEQRARAAGFDLAGIAAVGTMGGEAATDADQRFAAWIAAGHAGEMEYLKRADESGKLIRGDLRRSIPWARSVIVCAVNYNAQAPRSIDPAAADAGWIARYAWSGNTGDAASAYPGSDYHDVLLGQLQTVEAELQQRFVGCETRCYVDTGPLLEREYAVRAGIGWVGRNTCVIHQKQGSWLLLGVIVTSLALEPAAASVSAADRCGSCTRCIDACPTDALFPVGEVRQMDASRCIAYLTIEKKGSIPEELRAPMGRQVFGCDICQEVCPWNRRAPVAASGALPARWELINPALEWLGSLDGPGFNRLFRNSPVERTRRKRLLRNVAIAMGNSGEVKFLTQLDAWAAEDDPVLAESAAWAAARLRGQ